MTDKTILFQHSLYITLTKFRKKLKVHKYSISRYNSSKRLIKRGHFITYNSSCGGPFTNKNVNAGDVLTQDEVDNYYFHATNALLETSGEGAGSGI